VAVSVFEQFRQDLKTRLFAGHSKR